MKLLMGIVLVINIFGFALVGIDKGKAKNREWRIPEKNFFLTALFGGALGVLLGMYAFRHKTKHYTFTLGIPALFVINIFTAYMTMRKQPQLYMPPILLSGQYLTKALPFTLLMGKKPQ